MASYVPTTLVLVLAMLSFLVEASKRKEFFNDANELIVSNDSVGKKWAVLIAGSNTYGNYRHQADVCHAYQVLRKGGLKDENIIVFMYDDIAFSIDNPRRGIIINKPRGENVYQGVPKDYTGENVNVANFFAVILGNKTALTGGSGKVVDSGPNDHIFIYYSDHGSPGTLGMPDGQILYAKDLIDVLKKKHDANGYRRMVIYVEACESGSIFDGLLPENINIYATTASNPSESSWGTYCPGYYPDVAPEYDVCLGDMYSVSWIEDSEIHDLRTESLEQQYQAVRRRTAYEDLGLSPDFHSHVMQYGARELSNDFLVSYIGTNPANDDNITHNQNDFMIASSSTTTKMPVSQRDADLLHFFHKFQQAPEGSTKKIEAQRQLNDALSNRLHVDQNMNRIARLLFGSENSLTLLQSTIRPEGQPLVDDWDCFKLLVRIYEDKCGSLSRYGRKYMRAIANMCNTAKINGEQMALVSAQVCGSSTLPGSRSSNVHHKING